MRRSILRPCVEVSAPAAPAAPPPRPPRGSQVKDSPSGKDALYDLGMWDASPQQITGSDLMEFYGGLIRDFPVVTIEDGLDDPSRSHAAPLLHATPLPEPTSPLPSPLLSPLPSPLPPCR